MSTPKYRISHAGLLEEVVRQIGGCKLQGEMRLASNTSSTCTMAHKRQTVGKTFLKLELKLKFELNILTWITEKYLRAIKCIQAKKCLPR